MIRVPAHWGIAGVITRKCPIGKYKCAVGPEEKCVHASAFNGRQILEERLRGEDIGVVCVAAPSNDILSGDELENRILKDRFLSKTKRAEEPRHGMETPCLEWQAGKDKDGYGKFLYGRAHRAAWSFEHGDIPSGHYILHRCDNPSCVDVAHLFTGTNVDNMRDMKKKGRSLRGEFNPRAKLNEQDIALIFKMRSDGCKMKPIARKFGVSHQLVSRILQHGLWTHVKTA